MSTTAAARSGWWFAYGAHVAADDPRAIDILGVHADGQYTTVRIYDAGTCMWRRAVGDERPDVPPGLAALAQTAGAHAGWIRTTSAPADHVMTSGDTLRWCARRFLGIWNEGAPPRRLSLTYRARAPMCGIKAALWLLEHAACVSAIIDATPETCMLVHLTGTPIATNVPEAFPEMNEAAGQLVHAAAFLERAWSVHHHLILPRRIAPSRPRPGVAYEGGYNAPVHAETFIEQGVIVILDIESSYPSMVCEYAMDVDTEVPTDMRDGDALWEWFKAHAQARRTTPLPAHFEGAKKLRSMRPDPRFKRDINAVYGALANPHFAYYAPHVAAAITAACRHVIRQIHVMSETLIEGARIVMGDTDSVAVHMASADDAARIMHWCAHTFLHIRLKRECVLDRAIILAKKHYAGHVQGAPVPTVEDVLEERHVVVRGIETRHRTLCPFARRTLACAIRMALYPDESDDATGTSGFPTELPRDDDVEAWRLDASVERAYTTRKGEGCTFDGTWMVDSATGRAAISWYVRRQIEAPLRRVAEQAAHLHRHIDRLIPPVVAATTASHSVSWMHAIKNIPSIEARFAYVMATPDTAPCHVTF